MVRTAATAIKTGGGKSSKGAAVSGRGGGGGGSASGHKSRTTIGGNKMAERPIPKWQKPISNFFSAENILPTKNQVREFVQRRESVEEDKSEIKVLEAPEWQKSVTMFLKDTMNDEQQEGSSSTVIDPESSKPIKRKNNEEEIEDEDKENKKIYVTEAVELNPPKRTKVDYDYKNLEKFEDC